MELQRLILLMCVWTVQARPSRPLNDRPGELAWQAWLLVDSQSQPTEGDRRITPKSVFIAPKLGQRNDSLPDCAEGYQADQMGRCIKFVRVDQAAHLNFLLQRLNAVYATKPNEAESEEEPSPTSGPLQVNIPLGSGLSSGDRGDSLNNNNEEEAGAYDGEEDAPGDDTSDVANTEVVDDEYDDGAREESSTKFEASTNTQSAADERAEENTETTGRLKVKEATTGANEQDSGESTEQPAATTAAGDDHKSATSESLQALFFLVPISNASHVQNNRKANASDAPSAAAAPRAGPPGNSTPLTTDTEPSALPVKAKPDTETQALEDLATLIEPLYPNERHLSADLTNRRHLVRFPEEENPARLSAEQRPVRNRPTSLETHSLTNDEIEHLFQEFLDEARNPDHGAPYRKRPLPRFPFTAEHSQIQRPAYDAAFNHRNRDRNSDFWKIPPEPREENAQKPLVLRFERHPSSRYDTEFYYPQETSRYYEETTRENIPNIFPRRSRRNHFR